MLACRLTLKRVTYRHKRGARPRGCEDFLHDHRSSRAHLRRARPTGPGRSLEGCAGCARRSVERSGEVPRRGGRG